MNCRCTLHYHGKPPHSPLVGHIMSKTLQDFAHYIRLESVWVSPLFLPGRCSLLPPTLLKRSPFHYVPRHAMYIHRNFLTLYAIHHCSNVTALLRVCWTRMDNSTIFSLNFLWPECINNGSHQAWLKA